MVRADYFFKAGMIDSNLLVKAVQLSEHIAQSMTGFPNSQNPQIAALLVTQAVLSNADNLANSYAPIITHPSLHSRRWPRLCRLYRYWSAPAAAAETLYLN